MKRPSLVIATVIALSLFLAACGVDQDQPSGPTATPPAANARQAVTESADPATRSSPSVEVDIPEAQPEFVLRITVTPQQSGKVRVVPEAEGRQYQSGTVVVVAVSCDTLFVTWTGDVAAEAQDSNPVTVTMDRDRSLQATCAAPTPTPTRTSPQRVPNPVPTPVPRQPVAAGPPTDPVHWWPGDSNADDIVGGNHGILRGGTNIRPGKVGAAFSFDGADDHVSLPSQPRISSTFTISAWLNFNRSNFGRFQEVFNNNQFFLRKDSSSEGNRLSIFVTLADGSVEPRAQSLTVPSPGSWHHVAGTWDGNNLRIYVDGALQRTSPRRGSLTSDPVPARIGQGEQTSTTANPFSGLIDELAIFNRALSVAEVGDMRTSHSSRYARTHGRSRRGRMRRRCEDLPESF